MKTLYTLLLLLAFASAFAQDGKYQFARQVFKSEYKPQRYERFNGEITVVDDNTIKFGDKVLSIPNLSDDYKAIFTSGLFHPNVIVGDAKAVTKTPKEISELPQGQNFIYNLTRNDSVRIGCNFDELELLNPNPRTRRFVFWMVHKDIMNPQECYFELQNDKATRRTPLDEFIKGARLTFFHRGTLIL